MLEEESQQNKISLYAYESSMFTLGCIINNPNILLGGNFPMDRDDFKPCRLHYVLFATMENLIVNQGATEIDEILIQQYLEKHPTELELFNDNYDFFGNVKGLAKAGNISVYWEEVRKFSILRDYKKLGLNILKFYDEGKDENEQRIKLGKFKLDKIVNEFEGLLNGIKKKFTIDDSIEEMKAGEGFRELKELWKISPSYGYNMSSPYVNSINRGWQKGDLVMYSSGSGGGKTTYASGELCNVCASELYDNKLGKFVKNKQGKNKGLYILTEMNMKTQLQPKFISYIADVAYDKILDGKYEGNEEERIDKATDILFKDSEIYFVNMPKFTISKLRETISYYVATYNVGFIIFDYLADNNIVGAEISKASGVNTRQDMVLLTLAEYLKRWAEEFNVGMLTMSQLNGNEKVNEIVDEKCLFGSTAVKNKLDFGGIAIEPRKKELLEVESLIRKKGFGTDLENIPNLVMHNYKARFSKYGQNLKIWRRFDYGTGRIYDLFVTDKYNSFVDVERTMIEIEENE